MSKITSVVTAALAVAVLGTAVSRIDVHDHSDRIEHVRSVGYGF